MRIINYDKTISGVSLTDLKREFLGGATCEQLALKYNCHSATVFYKLKGCGCVPIREISYGNVAIIANQRLRVQQRDNKLFKLTGKCYYCLSTDKTTIRHHLRYPINRYNPDAIIEVCEKCHSVLHNGGCIGMPITNE